MPTKIFVGRLVEGTTNDDILVLFRKFGTVKECDVMSNYGFVHMDTEEEARAAIAALDGYSVKGSHIHVELSTASTQGRKKRSLEGGSRFNGGGRYDPYPSSSRRENYGSDRRAGGNGVSSLDRYQRREEYASDQVKDLLELYIRDPVAFDQYARSYYYGERSERTSVSHGYNDRRLQDGMYLSRR